MKELLRKWLCKPCKECPEVLEDLSRVYLGSRPTIGEYLFYLVKDEQGNDSMVMLPNGKYTYKGYVIEIENELVKDFYTK